MRLHMPRLATRLKLSCALLAVVSIGAVLALTGVGGAGAVTWTWTISSNIPVGAGPYNPVLMTSTDSLYVYNQNDGTVSVISAVTNAVIKTIAIGSPTSQQIDQIGVDQSRDLIYVPDSTDSTLTTINGATNTVSSIVAAGVRPTAVAVDEAANVVYVVDNVGDVYRYNGGATPTFATAIAIPVGAALFNALYDPDNNTLYTSDQANNVSYAINMSGPTPTPVIMSGINVVYGFTLDPHSGLIYTSSGEPYITVFNPITNAPIASLTVPNGKIYGAAVDTATGTLYFTDYQNEDLVAVDDQTQTLTGVTIPVPGGPYGAAYDANNQTIYTANYDAGTVSVLPRVTSPAFIATTVAALTVGSPVSFTEAATGSTPMTYAVTTGALPAGLMLDPATAQISGTPTTAGPFAFTLTATNAAGTAVQAYSGTVAAAAASATPVPIPTAVDAGGPPTISHGAPALEIGGVVALLAAAVGATGMVRRRTSAHNH